MYNLPLSHILLLSDYFWPRKERTSVLEITLLCFIINFLEILILPKVNRREREPDYSSPYRTSIKAPWSFTSVLHVGLHICGVVLRQTASFTLHSPLHVAEAMQLRLTELGEASYKAYLCLHPETLGISSSANSITSLSYNDPWSYVLSANLYGVHPVVCCTIA
jgi:hypothetical protein